MRVRTLTYETASSVQHSLKASDSKTDLGLKGDVASIAELIAQLAESCLAKTGDVLERRREDLAANTELVRLVGRSDVV